MQLRVVIVGEGLDAMAGKLHRQGTRVEQEFPTAIDGARTMAHIETAPARNDAGVKLMRVKDHVH